MIKIAKLHMRDADHAELCADQAAKGLEVERSVRTEPVGWREWVRTNAYDGFLNDLIERPGDLLQLTGPGMFRKFFSLASQLLNLEAISHDEFYRIDRELNVASNEFPLFPDDEEDKL